MSVRDDVRRVLASLKDFQRDSVEYAFQRMYLDQEPAHRFLIADEVGLGKTLVARGIIARAIEHLQEQGVSRADVIYICSNADIARQNIRRLEVFGQAASLPSRLTLLPTVVHNLRANRINFVSLTPGTSFDLKGAQGRWEERALLHWMLRRVWQIGAGTGPLNLLQGTTVKGTEWFRWHAKNVEARYGSIDDVLVQQFGKRLRLADAQTAADGGTTLQERFAQLADKLARRRNVDRIPSDLKTQQRQIIGELRRTLAEACLEALEPDLVIMDEFQRFKDLLKANDDAGILAKRLFDFQHTEGRARVLLLSATPYKMYTLSQEEVEDDHYRDFIETLRFLYDDDSKVEELDAHLKGYRDALLRMRRDNGGDLDDERAAIETRLRSVMIRTERLAATPERDGMLREVPSPSALRQEDVRDYVALHEVGAATGGYDSLEYWKSAPYLLSFMDHYAFKQAFTRSLDDQAVLAALHRGPRLLLPWEDIARYLEIDPANA